MGLEINPALVERVLVAFLREEITKAGFHRGVLGLSGGIDSAVSAALAARALGPENVWGIIMPHRSSNPESREHAELVARQLGIRSEVIDISPQIDAYFQGRQCTNVRRGNKMSRERMSVLYDYSAELPALVVGTSNKTETMIGYFTKWGDNACDIRPIADLYKFQIYELARELAVPEEVIGKAPTADLWDGQTDENEIGMTYEELDSILQALESGELAKLNPDRVERVRMMISASVHKRAPVPYFKVSR